MVVLTAELEVAEHNCDLSTSNQEDDKDYEQKAEDVVELVQPHWGQDEEKLNEHSSKRKDSSNENGEDRLHIPSLLRNLSRDFVSLHGIFHGRLFET